MLGRRADRERENEGSFACHISLVGAALLVLIGQLFWLETAGSRISAPNLAPHVQAEVDGIARTAGDLLFVPPICNFSLRGTSWRGIRYKYIYIYYIIHIY